jgi:hypothetical protein
MPHFITTESTKFLVSCIIDIKHLVDCIIDRQWVQYKFSNGWIFAVNDREWTIPVAQQWRSLTQSFAMADTNPARAIGSVTPREVEQPFTPTISPRIGRENTSHDRQVHYQLSDSDHYRIIRKAETFTGMMLSSEISWRQASNF